MVALRNVLRRPVKLPPIFLGLSVCGMAFVCYFLLVPEIQSGMDSQLQYKNFCIVSGKDRLSGCILVELVHEPQGNYCVYEVRGGIRTNYTDQERMDIYLDAFQVGLEYSCFHPRDAHRGDMRFLTFYGPKTGNWVVYGSLLLLLLLFCCCLSLHQTLREKPPPGYEQGAGGAGGFGGGGGLDEEAAHALYRNEQRMGDWEDQHQEMEDRHRKAQALLTAKVEREQEKRLEMSSEMQRERAERLRADDDLKSEVQGDMRRLEDLILSTAGGKPKGKSKHRMGREDVPRLYAEADRESAARARALEEDRRGQKEYLSKKLAEKKSRKKPSRTNSRVFPGDGSADRV